MAEDGRPDAKPATPGKLPLFYRQPQPLDTVRDAGLGIKDVIDFGFARETNSVPLAGVEFDPASAHYPIVFAAGERIFPVAVLGLRGNRNAFVDAAGRWLPGSYIPSYVRRYPFIFAAAAGSDKLTLCADRASDLLLQNAGRPLFADGKPTAVTESALKFCTEFEQQYRATLEFAEALRQQQLLVTVRADASLVGGEKLSLADLLIVDEARLNAVPDEMFLTWRRRNWLRPLHAHLRSQANWPALADRSAGAA